MRNKPIDISRGVAIILLIVLHSLLGHIKESNICLFIYNLGYGFHIPLFFMVSGYFYRQESVKERALHLYHKLFKPYLVCSVFLIIMLTAFQGRFFLNILSFLFVKATKQPICGFQWESGGPGPLWFLVCFCVANILFSYLLQIKRLYRLIIVCIMFEVCWLLRYTGYGLLPFQLSNAFFAIPFIWMGYELKSENFKKEFLKKPLVLIIGSGLTLFYVVYYKHPIGMASCSFPLNALNIIISIYMCCCVYILSCKFSSKILSFLGKNTLPIFIFHSIDFVLKLSSYVSNKIDSSILFINISIDVFLKIMFVVLLWIIFKQNTVTKKLFSIP